MDHLVCLVQQKGAWCNRRGLSPVRDFVQGIANFICLCQDKLYLHSERLALYLKFIFRLKGKIWLLQWSSWRASRPSSEASTSRVGCAFPPVQPNSDAMQETGGGLRSSFHTHDYFPASSSSENCIDLSYLILHLKKSLVFIPSWICGKNSVPISPWQGIWEFFCSLSPGLCWWCFYA